MSKSKLIFFLNNNIQVFTNILFSDIFTNNYDVDSHVYALSFDLDIS